MISMNEILKGRARFEDLPEDIRRNLTELHVRINKLRSAFGKPLKVNDGYRRIEDLPSNAARKSKHLFGQAIDLDDDHTHFLWNWTKDNLQLMKDIGLWMEDPRWTHGKIGTWMHYQIVPPASGNRIYVPSLATPSAPDIWDGKYDKKFN